MVETRGSRRFAILFLVSAFAVLFLGRWLKPVSDVTLTIAAPFQAVVSGTSNAIGATVSGIVDGHRYRDENIHLKQTVATLLRQNMLLQQHQRDDVLLRRMLRFDEANGHLELLTSRVIGGDPNYSVAPYVIIDRGTRDGLNPGMTVVDSGGYFVGSISDLTPKAAKVMLLTSPSSSVGAIDMRTQATGVVNGLFAHRPQLKYVLTRATVHVGDFVVTSGQYSLFPRTILLGQVVRVHRSDVNEFQSADIQPAADFNNLEMVQVVRNFVPSLPSKLITKP